MCYCGLDADFRHIIIYFLHKTGWKKCDYSMGYHIPYMITIVFQMEKDVPLFPVTIVMTIL